MWTFSFSAPTHIRKIINSKFISFSMKAVKKESEMDPKFDMHHILLIDKLSRTENFVKLKDNKRKERKARKIDMHATLLLIDQGHAHACHTIARWVDHIFSTKQTLEVIWK